MSDIVAALSERRTLRRLPSRLRTPCRLTRVTAEGSWLATVRNVSGKGIGLIANRPFRQGMVLSVELPGKGGKYGKARLLKVSHARPQAGNKWWVLGGAFYSKLSKEELAGLV